MGAAGRLTPLRAALTVAACAAALALPPRAASACSCIRAGARLLSPAPGAASSPGLPLLVTAPTDADIHIEDAGGQPIPSRGVLDLPRLGLCEMPWFLIGPDAHPWSAGSYRLVRGPDDADAFELTAAGVGTLPAALSVTLSVETHDPITLFGSECADPKISERPFSRTATLSFEFSGAAEAAPMYVTAMVSDPQTPGGLGDSTRIRPLGTTGPDRIRLPLEDGADACATVSVWNATGRVELTDTLCAAAGPETRSVDVQALVPAGPSPIVATNAFAPRGCSAAGGADARPSLSVAILSAALAFTRIWRKRRVPGRILRAWPPRRPITSTRTG